jgi:hypothetical protein
MTTFARLMYAIVHNEQYQDKLPHSRNDSKDDRGGSHKEAKSIGYSL